MESDRFPVSLKAAAYWFAAAASFYVFLTIGFYAIYVNHWPRFTQSDVLSDLIWLLFAALFWLVVLVLSMLLPGLLIASQLPGSRFEEANPNRSTPTRFNFDELTLLSALWIPSGIAYAAHANHSTTPEILEAILSATVLAAVMLIWGVYAKKARHMKWTSPSLSQTTNRVLSVRSLRDVAALFATALAILFQFLLVLAPIFLYFQITGRFALWFVNTFGNPQAANFSEQGFAMIVPMLFAVGSWASVLLVYEQERFRTFLNSFALVAVILVLLAFSVTGVLELARVGNMSRMTVVFDSKYSEVAGRLLEVERMGDFSVAHADVVFSFGSEVVLSKPGSISSSHRCDFSWLSNKELILHPGTMRCLALPKSAIASIASVA